MTLYCIRHGQTDWNAEQRFQGQRDIALNALGQQQASRNGEALGALLGADAGLFDFVSSPLGRTCETMERIRSAMGLDPKAYRTDARLVEICFGDWEGSTLGDLEKHFPKVMLERHRDKWNFQPPGQAAESFEMLAERIMPWLQSVSGPTVCVTHGGVMRTILQIRTGMDRDEAANLTIAQDRILKLDGATAVWL
jgi:broad specificity phosphatase PhoE